MNMNQMKRLNRLGLRFASVLLLSLAVAACGTTQEEAGSQEEEIPTVTVSRATLGGTSASHRFSGTVVSERTVQISTKVTGRVTQLDADEGDYAREGDILVRIKDDNLQAQKSQVEARLAEAESALANSETNYRRIKNLFEKESATRKELDDITTQYESAKAGVQALEARLREINDMLEYTVLEAPFNGYVVGKRVSEGDLAGPGQPLLSFEREGALKVELSVPETRLSLFALEDTMQVSVPAASADGFFGVVTGINPSGNRGSRQFEVEIALPESAARSGLKSGMFAEAAVAGRDDASVTVSESAVLQRGQLSGLYTLNSESEVVLRWIRTGAVKEGRVEVLSGLSPGEEYVASFDAPLREGQKVNAQ